MPSAVRKALAELARWGILMHADAVLPSVTSLVAGEAIKGSWWGHPQGHAIFAVLEELDDSSDATTAKLVNGKVTLVHRALFAELAAIGAAREAWQTKGLSQAARALVERSDDHGRVRTDELPPGTDKKDVGRLEQRLLLHSRQVHTESGAHARVLSPWKAWAREEGIEPLGDLVAAKACFEEVVARWEKRFDTKAKLPW